MRTTGSFTVNPAAIDHFSMTAATTTPVAGATDDLSITAIDPYGNTATGYTGAHNLTFSGAGSIRTYNPTVTNNVGTAIDFGGTTAITFTNGVSSAGGVMTLYKAETAHLVVSDGSHQGSLDVTVSPAGLSILSLSAEKVVVRPGATDQLTIRAIDTYGNTAAGYGDGPHNLTFSGGSGTRTVTNSAGTQIAFGTATSITFTNGVSTAGGVMRISNAQVANITATDGTYTSPALRIVVSSVSAIGGQRRRLPHLRSSLRRRGRVLGQRRQRPAGQRQRSNQQLEPGHGQRARERDPDQRRQVPHLRGPLRRHRLVLGLERLRSAR